MQISTQGKSSSGLNPTSGINSLAFVIQNQSSGLLKIQKNKILWQFYWNQGECTDALVNVKSALPGTYLFQKKIISPEIYATYLQKIKSPSHSHWDVLSSLSSQESLHEFHKNYIQMLFMSASKEISVISKLENQTISSPSLISGLDLLRKFSTSIPLASIVKYNPSLTQTSNIRLLKNIKDSRKKYDLSTEEKGLLTTIEDNQKIDDIVSSSFLDQQKIFSSLFLFSFLDLIEIKSAENAQRDHLILSLSEDDKKVREHIIDIQKNYHQRTYYEWIGISSKISAIEVQKLCLKKIEFFASPKVEKLFTTSEKFIFQFFLERLKEARKILTSTQLRKKYHQFLDLGNRSPFPRKSGPSISTKKPLNQLDKIKSNPFDLNLWTELEKQNQPKFKLVLIKAIAQKIPESNFYDFLGLSPDATLGQIKKNYRILSKRFHPDKYYSEKEEGIHKKVHSFYKKIVLAYTNLKDPKKRQNYDKKIFS